MKELMSPKKEFEVAIHGLLLWASVGFLSPLGILIIRVSNTAINKRSAQAKPSSATKLRALYYSHVILQILSMLLSTAGAVMSFTSFENSFSNHHQRIGLALYIAIWVQTVTGFLRPQRDSQRRRGWYLLHWLLGMTISIVGIANIYLGLEAYRIKASKNVRIWTILFTAQVSVMALVYLLQDKWHYLRKQRGAIPCSGDEPIRPSQSSPPSLDQYYDQESNPQRVVVDGKITSRDQPYPQDTALKSFLK